MVSISHSSPRISLTAVTNAFGVIELFNIIGACASGTASNRFRKKNILALIYCLRAVVAATLLFAPIDYVTAVIFGANLGISWLSTVPMICKIVEQIFGAWLGSYIYDVTGFYHLM